jgi:hypothetical protein
MLTLDTLNIMLAVSEEAMIEEMIVALLASPKMVVFFKNFLALKKRSLTIFPAGANLCVAASKIPMCRRSWQKRSFVINKASSSLMRSLSFNYRKYYRYCTDSIRPGLGKRSNWSMTTAPLRPPYIRFFSSAGA